MEAGRAVEPVPYAVGTELPEWRDKLALSSRRQADYAWQVLAKSNETPVTASETWSSRVCSCWPKSAVRMP